MIGLKMLTLGLAGTGFIAGSAFGIASAAHTNNLTKTVGSSGIPSSIYKQAHLNAEAKVLNTSSQNVQSSLKNKDLADLIKKDGLNHKTYSAKVKAVLTSSLETEGYSKDQITIALQQRLIHHLRRRIHDQTKS